MKKSLISATAALALASSLSAETVTILTDENDACFSGAGCSLREAINETTSGGTIDFAVTGTLEVNYEIPIYNDVTINGGSGIDFNATVESTRFSIGDGSTMMPTVTFNDMTVNSVEYGSAFVVNSGSTLNLNNVAVTNVIDAAAIQVSSGTLNLTGSSVTNNIGGGMGGAAIYGDGNITVDQCQISGNDAGMSHGAAFYSYGGSITITNSVIEDNNATGGGALAFYGGTAVSITESNISNNHSISAYPGGAVYAWSSGSLNIQKSNFLNNTSEGEGGAIYVSNVTTSISDTTISGSSASSTGGGIYIDGPALITNSTISGNTANEGGGIYTNSGITGISHSTIAYNTALSLASGGGIYQQSGSGIEMKSTLLAYNTSSQMGPDCYSVDNNITTYGYNLVSDSTDCNLYDPMAVGTDFYDADPFLAPLFDNGGPTLTHAVIFGSPAIENGAMTDISETTVLYDQRGVARSVSAPTIGSFEYVPPTVNIGSTSIDFGYIPSGGYAEQYITLTNTGPSDFNLSSLYFDYASPEFAFDSSACDAGLLPGSSCDILVSVSPASENSDFYDRLVITGNDTLGTQYVDIYANSWVPTTAFTGTMTLPLAATGDLYIEIFAEETDSTGTESYSWYGGEAYFSSGVTSASFEVPIDNTSGYYKVGYRAYEGDLPVGYLNQAYVGSSGPVWAYSDARVFTASELEAGLTLSMLQGLTLSGTVSLPSGVTASSDLPVHVDSWYDTEDTTVSTGYDYYYGWDDIIIPAGQSSVSYSIAVPDTGYGWRVEYWLDELTSPTNLYGYGYYTTSGTTPYYEDASQVYTGGSSQSGIDLNILSAYTVSGTIAKPSGYTSTYLDVNIVAHTSDNRGFGWYWSELNSSVDQVDYTLRVPETAGDYKLAYEFYNYGETVQDFLPIISRGYYAGAATTPYESQATLLSNTGNKTGINLQLLEGVLKTGTLSIDQTTLEQYYGAHLFAETNTDRIGSSESYIYDSASGLLTLALVLPSDLSDFRIGVELYDMESYIAGYLGSDGSTVGSRDDANIFASVNDVGTIALTSSGLSASPDSYTDQVSCESAGYFWTGTYCTYEDSSETDFRIEFGHDITAAEYTAAVALDPSFLANTEMYMLSYESYKGYSSEKFAISGATEYAWSIYDFNPSTLEYDTLSESLTFTKGTDNVLVSSRFDIKYTGTQSARDLNSTIFSTAGSVHRFVYSQKVDEYELYEQQTNYFDDSLFTSIDAFLQEFSTGYNYFDQKEGAYDTGLGFAYSSGATSGALVEIENGVIVSQNAGSWEIVSVTDIGSVLTVSPNDTVNYHENMIWAVQTDGYLYRGELRVAGSGFNFYLFDQAAHDEFARYIETTYGVAIPSIGFDATELVGQTFYIVRADGTYGVVRYNNDGTTRLFTSGSFVPDATEVTQNYTINSSGQIVVEGSTTETLVSKTSNYIEVSVNENGSETLQRVFDNLDYAQSYLDSISVTDTALKLQYSAGWNLLSLPAKAHLDAFDLGLTFGEKSGSIEYLAKYDSIGWSYYLVDRVEPTVSRFTTLDSGEGFWLRASSAGEIVFSFTEDTAYANQLRPLRKGWNLVGVNRNMTVAELRELYGDGSIKTMWIYDGEWKASTGYDVDVEDEDGNIVPGFTNISRTNGVWIRVE